MEFEWDPAKRDRNLRVHGVDFLAAAGLLLGSSHTAPATRGRSGEKRYLAVGPLPGEEVPTKWSGPLCAVVYTKRGDDIYRIISARRARTDERRAYRKHARGGGPEAPR